MPVTNGDAMRIAIISPGPLDGVPIGGKRVILDLAVGLSERGYSVDIYAIPRRGLDALKRILGLAAPQHLRIC